MRKFLAAIGLLSTAASPNAGKYAEGQVWSYHVRAGDEGSTLQINKIERDPGLGLIFHISVLDVRVGNPHAAEKIATDLPHLPVSRQTLDKSVIALLKSPAQEVAYQAGYAEWKHAFDDGQAGIFTLGVAEIVDNIERTVYIAAR